MSTVVMSSEEVHTQGVVLKALRASKGRVTLGDVVTATGLSRDDAESTLKVLLSTHEGHLEVSEDGDLVYLFDPKLVRRDHRSGWQRFKEKAVAGLTWSFKVWTMLMLVVYFVIYVCLAIAAFVALNSQNREGSSSSRSSHRGGGLPIHWLLYMFWTPDWRYGRHYYGDSRSHGRQRSKASVPFYKKVFAFIFGPDEPERDPREKDRLIAQLIRARRGVLTTPELIEITGDDYAHAESEMGRLMGAFDGDVHVTEDGEMVYTFPELMLSTEGKGSAGSVSPAWQSLEDAKQVTGNKSGTNTIISFLNGFNLLFSLISPTTIFPILGIAGLGAMVGLVYVPFVFSMLFFAIPAVRTLTVRKENGRRHGRNARRLVLREIFEAARHRDATVAADAMSDRVSNSLRESKTQGPSDTISKAVRTALAEFDADVDVDIGGTADKEIYAFPALKQTLEVSEVTRRKLSLDTRKVGEIVFSSADDEKQAEEREMAEFEKELEVGEGVEVH